MNTFWLEWLKTPMAAPETRTLKTMRMAILIVDIAIVLAIAFLRPLREALGPAASGGLAGLSISLAVLVAVYVVTKNRADGAYLDELVRPNEGREEGDVAVDVARARQ